MAQLADVRERYGRGVLGRIAVVEYQKLDAGPRRGSSFTASVLEQIGFKLNHFVIPFRRVNPLYHIDRRANDIVICSSGEAELIFG